MITVLTASIPQRAALLAEAVASVNAQLITPDAHLIGVDHARQGAPHIYNALAHTVTSTWVTFLDDDDLLDPDHLVTLLDHSEGVDVVYTPPKVQGRPFTSYDGPFNPLALRVKSIVPITAMIRTELYEEVGGMPDHRHYDWRFWQRVANAGGKFRKVDRPTWTYRLDTPGGNHSWGEL